MYFLVYVSKETGRFSNQELDDLLQKSRLNNLAAEITGLLLYKDGNFMQVLERAKEAVHSILATITGDSRHRNLMVLSEGETPKREFKDWSMGFKKLGPETPLEFPGYSDFLDLPLTGEPFLSNPSQALPFLLIFKKSVL